MSTNRIAIVGVTGWLGSALAREALERSHSVTAVVRDRQRAEGLDPRMTVAEGSVTDAAALATAFDGANAVVIAYRPAKGHLDEMLPAARAVLTACRQAGVSRLIWLGAAPTLRMPGGGDIVDLPVLDEEWKASGLVHREVLRLLRTDGADLEWTNVSPPRTIEDGARTGSFRIGQDEMLFDSEGNSRITVSDYVAAIVRVIETGEHAREHITVAY